MLNAPSSSLAFQITSRAFATSLLFILPLTGQDDDEIPAIPGIIPPAQVEQEQAPVPVPAQQPPVQPNLGDTQITELIEEPKLSGDDLAALYRKYTGRRVIVTSAAAQAEFSFIQDASPQDPLTYAEAAELLRKAATIENFIFVPDATDPNLDFLTLATAGLKPTGRGVDVYTESDPLPEGDAVISYVMTLSYIKPDEAVRTFTQIIGQFGAFGSIAAVPNAASIVITENTSLIRKLIDLKEQIDKPSSQVATRFINVQYADVSELAATLNELLTSQQGAGRTAGVQRAEAAAPPGVPTEGIPGATSSGEETPVQIIPDARTNRIFAMGRPVDLLFVEGLVREFDTESDQRNFLRRKLKFLAVADFLPIAGDALTRAFSGTGDASAQQGGGQTQQRGSQQRGGQTQQQQGGNIFQGGGGAGGAGGAGGGTRGNALSDPQINSAPQSLLVGRTLLVADNITNSIVVQGPPSGVEIIEKLLDQVDVKADQVMISTVFGQLDLGNNLETGVDWIRAFRGNNNGGVAGSSLTGGRATNNRDPLDLFQPVTGTALGTFPSQTGLSLYGRIGNSLAGYINLLSNSNDFTILSRPSIFTANNQRGTISSGRRIAIPTNSNQFSGGGVSTNIEYRDVVLKLEVIPLVNSENEITLTIALLSDEVVGLSDAIEGVGRVPIIATRELLTTVTVPNNQTIVLGGLITTNDTEGVTGIPVLSNIPGLGRLFSSKVEGKERSELMIFIQPSIVNNDRSLDYVQTDMDSRYSVSNEARTFADGNVLPPINSIPEAGKDSRGSVPPRAIPAPHPALSNPDDGGRSSLRPIHRR